MANIVLANQLNVSGLTDPDLYVEILSPPPYVQGVPTDVIGLVGTASWGPVNTPVHMGTGQDATASFGPISAASLTDPYDLATDLYLAFGQASGAANLEGWAVRVTDGTDVAASAAASGTATGSNTTFTIGGTASNGDVITVKATSGQLAGSPVSVAYTVPSGATLASVAAGIATAINANVVLSGAYVTAIAVGAVVNVYAPSSLSATWSYTLSGGASETVSQSTGSQSSTGGSWTAVNTGVLGNQISINVANGVFANTYDVVVSSFFGVSERFVGLAATGFWPALKNALANGQNGIRGPSQWVRLNNVNAAVGAPTLGSVTLAGGTDGRAGVNTSTLLGSSTALPPTGLWAMSNVTPAVGIAWLTGCTDSNALATLVSFDQQAGATVLFPFATGTTTTAAVAAVQTNGESDPGLIYVKDSVYFQDTVNNQRRLVLPTAVIGGTWATYSPEQSPLNKPVRLVLGTERVDPVNGTRPYSGSEVGQLHQAGVVFITNPIPAGNQFGIRTGRSTAINATQSPAEWYRMTMFIARSLDGVLGTIVGQLQSQQANDPLREQVEAMLNSFAQTLKSNSQVSDARGYCQYSSKGNAGNGVNTDASIAAHYLYALFKATYLSSVWYFICAIEGGTTVVTVQQAAPTT